MSFLFRLRFPPIETQTLRSAVAHGTSIGQQHDIEHASSNLALILLGASPPTVCFFKPSCQRFFGLRNREAEHVGVKAEIGVLPNVS